jgi:uncharacterized protein (TIGR01244 family)
MGDMTNRRPLTVIITVTALASVLGCASTARTDQPEPPKLADWEDLRAVGDGSVYLAAQPSDEALDEFASRGGGLVINMRTDEEMAFLPYYDRSVASRGLKYVRIPTRGSELGVATDAALADALAGSPGTPVLIHCASGGRATYALAMRRMASEGLTTDEAAAWIEEIRGDISDRGRELLANFEAERAADGTAGASAAEGRQD